MIPMTGASVRLAPILALALVCACASPWTGTDYYEPQPKLTEADAHLEGEALEQRKDQMRRAHRDLVSLHETARSLRRHWSFNDIRSFEGFVDPYLAEHVHSLLSEEEEGWHSELALLDANLLFAQAALLVELREKRRVGSVIREIARRFVGMETMLVEYPIGEQSTLAHALLDLRNLRHNI
jgi:hypothetical protein